MARKIIYNDDELGKIIHQEIGAADGADHDELQAHRKKALDYYYNAKRGDEKPGESTVQSSDLADMTNAVLAQLVPMLSKDALVMFESQGEADEDQARMETMAVNDVVLDQNAGYVELQEAVKDACLCRNAFAKVWVEDNDEVEIRTLRGMPQRQVNQIVGLLNKRENTEAEQVERDEDSGEIKIKVKTTTRQFRWRAVDPVNFLYQAGWDQQTLEGIRFCAERDTPTRSDLIKEGYDADKVAALETITTETRDVQHSRDTKSQHEDVAQTEDQERVERHTCYLRIDMDGDGVSEQWQIIVGGQKTVLDKEMVQWVPFACGALFIKSHRLEGEDLFDRLKQTQDIKTATYRRWLDGLYNAVWPRLAAMENNVDEAVDDARSGATIWTKGPPGEALMAVPYTDIGPSARALMDYEDTRRTERGGAALDMQANESQIVGETMGGIQQQYAVKEQLTQMMARNLGETLVRGVYLLMHKTLRTFGRPIQVELKGQWQTVDPTGWPSRQRVNVVPGLTPAQRRDVEQAMMYAMQAQIMALQNGLRGQLTDLPQVYRTTIDYLRAKGVSDPEQYWIDPASPQAQQAMQQAGQQQQQEMAMQMQLMQQQLQMAQQQLQLEKYKTDEKTFTDLYKADLDAEMEEAKLAAEGVQSELDRQAEARQSATETQQSRQNGTGT